MHLILPGGVSERLIVPKPEPVQPESIEPGALEWVDPLLLLLDEPELLLLILVLLLLLLLELVLLLLLLLLLLVLKLLNQELGRYPSDPTIRPSESELIGNMSLCTPCRALRRTGGPGQGGRCGGCL